MPRSKQQQKRGVDFKKIKRKLGRKLPPPKNATNTEIKSKAIILPEQSVAAEKAGLAVNKNGLTLKELLQRTSHHNFKVRRDALMGIKDLVLNHPLELWLHRYAIIEKLRERINDDDQVVRETLYRLLKTVIFPGCKEDNQGPFISLMMTYIFNAMTHLSIEIRLMAFKFLDLVIQFYPPCFFADAEKILQHYDDILTKNRLYVQEKGKLKNTLAGLVRCLTLLPRDKREVHCSEKNVVERPILHGYELEQPTESSAFYPAMAKLRDLVPVLVSCFQDFIPLVHSTSPLDAQSFECMLSILQSISLAVRFFIYQIQKGKRQWDCRTANGESDETVWVQSGNTFVALKKLLSLFPLKKDGDRYFILNIVITEIFLRFSLNALLEKVCPTAVLLESFVEFIECALVGKICSATRSGQAVWEKHLLSLLPFLPKLVTQVASDWKFRLLQAFTQTFLDCNPESSLKLACLYAVEEMLIPGIDKWPPDPSDPEIQRFQLTWVRVLPSLLVSLDDKHPSSSKVVLHLLLRLGQCAVLELEYNNMQHSLLDFYRVYPQEENICYGPFVRLPRDCQELSIYCLYYFSNLEKEFLMSIASYCCLCPELEPDILFQTIEVLDLAYTDGRIQISDHFSFLITLLSSFKVFPECINPVVKSDKEISNRATFKKVTSVVCSCLSRMGDSSLIFQILEDITLHQISLKPRLDNECAMLRMLVWLDTKPTRFSEQSIITLSNSLAGYLIDVIHCIPEDDDEATLATRINTWHYYLTPCVFLFDRSYELRSLVLKRMGSLISERTSSSVSHNCIRYAKDCLHRIYATVSVLLFMHKDDKFQKIIPSFKDDSFKDGIDCILQSIRSFQSAAAMNMNIEERHKINCAYDQLKIMTGTST